MTDNISILYVEDDPHLGLIVKESLESRSFNVFFCKNAAQAINILDDKEVTIAILDIMLPEMDGFELAKKIHQKNNQIPFIFLSAKSQTADVIRGFELGAHDYIKKPFSIEELIIRIQAIISRNQSSLLINPSDEIKIGKYRFHPKKQLLEIMGEEKRLSHKENEILRMLCEHKNQLLERDKVLLEVWKDNGFFQARSMDVFITKLRKHLAKDSEVKIINIRGIGYKLLTSE